MNTQNNETQTHTQTQTKLNMIHNSTLKLPNAIWDLTADDPYSNVMGSTGASPVPSGASPESSSPHPDDPAPGSTVSAYIKARQEAYKRRPTREELRIGGSVSEGANATDAPSDSQRAGGPVTESAAPKPYEPGDMPPNAGPGFSDNPQTRHLPKISHSPNPPASSRAISSGPSLSSARHSPLPAGDGRMTARIRAIVNPTSQIQI